MLAVLLLSLSSLSPPSGSPELQGHIFVLNTDLRYLACDVWLCPVSSAFRIKSNRWRIAPEELPVRPEGWAESVHAVRCHRRTAGAQRARREERHRRYDHPHPILANVKSAEGKDDLPLTTRIVALQQFLDLAMMELQGERAICRFGRRLPLVAIPILGTGLASDDVHGADDSGEILLEMLKVLNSFTCSHAVDIALCTVDESAYGAALMARRKGVRPFCHALLCLHGGISLLSDLSPARVGPLIPLHSGLAMWHAPRLFSQCFASLLC